MAVGIGAGNDSRLEHCHVDAFLSRCVYVRGGWGAGGGVSWGQDDASWGAVGSKVGRYGLGTFARRAKFWRIAIRKLWL